MTVEGKFWGWAQVGDSLASEYTQTAFLGPDDPGQHYVLDHFVIKFLLNYRVLFSFLITTPIIALG
jgi:hypothetical protein